MDIVTMNTTQLQPLNLSQYQTLFNLTEDDLNKKILDFPARLNSFNAEMFQLNRLSAACDELYGDSLRLKQFSQTNLTHKINSLKTIQQFEKDFQNGLKENRYVAGTLPQLPFNNHQFDLMLSSFFFFLNEDHLDNCWNNLMEMLRVATEVRIAPLLSEQNLQVLLGPLMLKLQMHSFGIEIRSITFPGLSACAMLRVWSQNCSLS